MSEYTLEQVGFFAGMRPEHIERIEALATRQHFLAGASIFREGEPANNWWLIEHGDVALQVRPHGRDSRVLQTLHQGDVLGWSWLFPPYRWAFDATTITSTDAMVFDAVALRAEVESDDRLNADLMRRFARIVIDRLQATRLQLLDVYGDRG